MKVFKEKPRYHVRTLELTQLKIFTIFASAEDSDLIMMKYIITVTVAFLSAAFLTQTVCLDDTTVKFEIWDTAGQERYHSLAPMYYRGAQAAIVVYDITNEVSTINHGLID